MRILIAIDGSPHSDAAIEFVAGLSWPAGSSFLVVSAVQMPEDVYQSFYVPGAATLGGALESAKALHQDAVERARRRLAARGFQVDARVLEGDPRGALIEAAETESADLIVVGSHGRTGLAKLLIGSVATHVVTHAPCSVLVIKLPELAE